VTAFTGKFFVLYAGCAESEGAGRFGECGCPGDSPAPRSKPGRTATGFDAVTRSGGSTKF